MSFLDRFPTLTPNKVIKIIIGGLVLIIILSVIVVAISNNNTEVVNNETESDTDIAVEPEVTLKSFEEATALEQIDPAKVGLRDPVLFLPENQVGFFNTDRNLRINSETIQSNINFIPTHTYTTTNNIIINSPRSSVLYNINDKNFLEYDQNITQVTPFPKINNFQISLDQKYLFLSKSGEEYTLNQSSSIRLDQEIVELAKFTLSRGYVFPEIRILNNNIYVIQYQGSSYQGDIEIWSLSDNELKLEQWIQNIQSISFGQNKILYTFSSERLRDITNYESRIIDFSNPAQISIINLNIIERLIQDNILGNFLASRCTFTDIEDILCLIKTSKVRSDIPSFKDSLVRINLENNEITYPIQGIVFSASNVYFYNNQIYILGQQNNLLYRVKE